MPAEIISDDKDEDDSGNEGFKVEKVLEMRINKDGTKEYRIKWQGYPDTDNSWEPESNCANCSDLIAEFEATRALDIMVKSSNNKNVKHSNGMGTEKAALTGSRGFDRGLQPEKILGATHQAGVMNFLIKWRGCDDVDLVPAVEANTKCPQLAIKFYEDRLPWITD